MLSVFLVMDFIEILYRRSLCKKGRKLLWGLRKSLSPFQGPFPMRWPMRACAVHNLGTIGLSVFKMCFHNLKEKKNSYPPNKLFLEVWSNFPLFIWGTIFICDSVLICTAWSSSAIIYLFSTLLSPVAIKHTWVHSNSLSQVGQIKLAHVLFIPTQQPQNF